MGRILLLTSALAACGSGDGATTSDGKSLYFSKGCVACHGSRGEGSFMGPPLAGVSTRWTREELARFFLDPPSYTDANPRLKQLSLGFRTPMKPIPASEAERLAIADHVLATN